MRMPWACAWATIWSPAPKVKLPWEGSVASHFISFSGVTLLNSRSRIVEYVESPSLLAATAAPKYRPVCAAAAPSVLAAALADVVRINAVQAAVPVSASAEYSFGRLPLFLMFAPFWGAGTDAGEGGGARPAGGVTGGVDATGGVVPLRPRAIAGRATIGPP